MSKRRQESRGKALFWTHAEIACILVRNIPAAILPAKHKESAVTPRSFGIPHLVIAVCWLVSSPAPAGEIVFEQGIEYSNPDGQHLQLNLARPKASQAPTPAVLCIHGGGFRAGNRDRWNPLCRELAERGYVAATVTYRLAPKYQFPAAVHDVKAAVRWLRAGATQYGIDPARIVARNNELMLAHLLYIRRDTEAGASTPAPT